MGRVLAAGRGDTEAGRSRRPPFVVSLLGQVTGKSASGHSWNFDRRRMKHIQVQERGAELSRTSRTLARRRLARPSRRSSHGQCPGSDIAGSAERNGGMVGRLRLGRPRRRRCAHLDADPVAGDPRRDQPGDRAIFRDRRARRLADGSCRAQAPHRHAGPGGCGPPPAADDRRRSRRSDRGRATCSIPTSRRRCAASRPATAFRSTAWSAIRASPR